MTRDDFSVLALSYLEEVTAFARRLTGNLSDADDLVQATFERAFAAWQDLRSTSACRAWLFRISHNLFADSRRAARSRPELHLVEPVEAASPDLVMPAEAAERLDARELEDALRRLPRDLRKAVLLCDLWGFSYAEIAEITRSPIGTVRSRIARARARLAALLGDRAAGRGRGNLR